VPRQVSQTLMLLRHPNAPLVGAMKKNAKIH
jgi:hypothetical protein